MLLAALFRSVCREGHIAHIPLPDHSFSGSTAKCSQPLGADPRREILRTSALWLGNLGELVGRVCVGRWWNCCHPIYFTPIYVRQRVCIYNSLLVKLSDSGKTI